MQVKPERLKSKRKKIKFMRTVGYKLLYHKQNGDIRRAVKSSVSQVKVKGKVVPVFN
jgi:hypothetical protein